MVSVLDSNLLGRTFLLIRVFAKLRVFASSRLISTFFMSLDRAAFWSSSRKCFRSAASPLYIT